MLLFGNIVNLYVPNLYQQKKWAEIIQGFERHANLSNCIGIVECKHIRVAKPIDNGSLFYNYKNYVSIFLTTAFTTSYLLILVCLD